MTVTGVRIIYRIYRNSRSSTRVNALESRARPFRSTATGFKEHETMTLTVSV
jgi:hypothetical protein